MLIECIEECLLWSFGDGATRRAAAVVDQNVHISFGQHLCHSSRNICRVLKISNSDRMTFPTEGAQRFIQAVEIAGEQGHLCPKSSQLLGSCEADALGRTAYQGSFARQIQGQNMLFTHAAKGRQTYFGPMKRLEHLGIAVSNLKEAEQIFTDVLGVAPYKREEVADEGVLTSFFQTGDSKVELLESTSPEGPVARHLARRGPGLHHVAFLVDDLEGEIARLERSGYRVISGPKAGADNKRIAFLHPSDTAKVLVELCEEM